MAEEVLLASTSTGASAPTEGSAPAEGRSTSGEGTSAGGGGVVKIDIDQKNEEYCIHKVPRNLRKVNEEAYTPQLISIGPYHHGKEQLVDMEKHKIRYTTEFYQRINKYKESKRILKTFIEVQAKEFRRLYADLHEFPTDKFAEMILCYAVFIIELFLKFFYRDSTEFLLNEVWLGAIRRDLQLFENQLPYVVLENLYNNFVKDKLDGDLQLVLPFFILSCFFFRLHLPPNRPPFVQPNVKLNHFTDLCRYALMEIPPHPKIKGMKPLDNLPNAGKLEKSGVKFKGSGGKYLVDIILKKRTWPISLYDVVELKIPRIEITDNTESLLRNIMALEQCHYSSETYICSYIDLMDSLINTESDVDLLVEEGIIYGPTGDNAATANMFNKLQLQIPPSPSSYYFTTYKDVRNHYNKRSNHAMATLKSVYFSNPWIGTGTVVAIILLLLTLIQTVFSVLQIFLAK